MNDMSHLSYRTLLAILMNILLFVTSWAQIPPPPPTAFHISYPDINHRGFGIGSTNTFTAAPTPGGGTIYTWTASGGTFPNGNTGYQVTYVAPSSPGQYTVTCTASGTGYNPPVADTRTIDVLRLDKVRVVYTSSATPVDYPTNQSNVKIRAVVYVTCTSMNPYYVSSWGSGETWYITGRDEPNEPFASSETYSDSPSTWPSNWGSISFTWRKLYHQASAPIDHHRIYSYNDQNAPSWTGWGSNYTYLPVGTIRYRVQASLLGQTEISYDKANATRISVRDASMPNDPQGRTYLKWLAAYLYVPYEWGGSWFGGKDSEGGYAGGSNGYQYYGIDCSGLVCNGARWSGYNWSPWRVFTVDLGTADDSENYYTSPVSDANFTAGDILNKRESHVQSCVDRDGDDVEIIHASGENAKVCLGNVSLAAQLADGYKRRRLREH